MYTYAFTPLPYSTPKPKGKRVASFCSGGDLGFSLQSQHAISVDLLVIDDFHSAYIDIKRYAYCNLKESGFQTLMGINQAGRRVFLYHQIRSGLLHSSSVYFDRKESRIRTGLCQQFIYEKYLHQALPFRPKLSSLLFPIWMDALRSRLHWIPFRKSRHQWRNNSMNITDWYNNPEHFEWHHIDNHQTRIVPELKGLYSDIYLFEPSQEMLRRSMKSLQQNGRLWIWSWNLIEGVLDDGKLSAIQQIRGAFTPPLFEWYRT